MSIFIPIKEKKEVKKPIIVGYNISVTTKNGYYCFQVEGEYIVVNCFSNPFANCQLMTISPIANIKNVKDTIIIKNLLKKIYDNIGKRMIAIDINKVYEEIILNQLAPYSLDVKRMDYTSSNGSEMVMCVFRLNEESIK